jgi:hypothetical protein
MLASLSIAFYSLVERPDMHGAFVPGAVRLLDDWRDYVLKAHKILFEVFTHQISEPSLFRHLK